MDKNSISNSKAYQIIKPLLLKIKNAIASVIPAFFKSKVFFKHAGIAFTLITAIIISVLFGLDAYTHHNEYYIVPDLYGMDLYEADETLEYDNLHMNVIDSVYQKDAKAGSIIEQMPKAQKKVKENRNISVIICSSKPESIPFPNITNMPFRQTLSTLTNLGLKVGMIQYQAHKYKNLVLELKYKDKAIIPGSMIEKGSYIDMVLGGGGNNRVLMPNVVGKTVKEARSSLHYSYLNVEIIYKDYTIKTKKDFRTARVWKQSPEYSRTRRLQAGSKLKLWITLDKGRFVETNSSK
ncbi:MAG: PASTA domain-containing protein [Marinifilaceae bacterium]